MFRVISQPLTPLSILKFMCKSITYLKHYLKFATRNKNSESLYSNMYMKSSILKVLIQGSVEAPNRQTSAVNVEILCVYTHLNSYHISALKVVATTPVTKLLAFNIGYWGNFAATAFASIALSLLPLLNFKNVALYCLMAEVYIIYWEAVSFCSRCCTWIAVSMNFPMM